MSQPGPGQGFRGVVFDMDGVLTDSEPAFFAAVNDVLARFGERISFDDYAQFIGSATPVTWAGIIKLKGLPVALDAIIADYEAPLMARLREPRPPLPGARELIDALRARRVALAVCTASYTRWADAVLGGAGLLGRFDALSTADMVSVTKPHPEPYLLAASKLGLAPAECLAIEDSLNGIASALAAGLFVVQLRATSTSALPAEGVGRVIASLSEFPLDLVVAPASRPA